MTRWLLILILLCGCDRPGGAAASASVSPSQSPPVVPQTRPATSGGDDVGDVETVDDTPDPEPEDSDVDAGDDEEDPEASCAPKDPNLKPMQLLKFRFTDGIDGRDPRRKLTAAKAGQRVYAHMTMRNRSGHKRCLRIVFRIGGKKRTALTLPIGKSWSWRTYAYNTLRTDDDKPLELTVTDDQGAIVVKKMLPVIPKKN